MNDVRLIHLDHAAGAPMRPAAVEAMLPYLTDRFANPSGAHRAARASRRAVDDARDVVAGLIGCRPGEVVFTSGGTESDNAAIFGAPSLGPGDAVCPAAEHPAVLAAVERRRGRIVPVDRYGHVDLDALETAVVAAPTAVVSVMAVNNEVGTITDLAAVRARAGRAIVHSDAVQAAPWLDLRQVWAHVDAVSLSAHKFGGPKGVGVLAVRSGVALAPFVVGGGQERDRRSGTHNVAGIVATAAALAECDAERETDVALVSARRDRLVKGLVGTVGGVHETVPADHKVAGAAHVLIDGVESEALLYRLDEAGVCASAASACASGAMEPSHVLAAMGVAPTLIRGALRLSLGPTTTDGDIDAALDALAIAISTLRERAAARTRS